VRILIPNTQRSHARNLEENFYRPYQISFLPFLGTNHLLSGEVVNEISLNVLVGYSAGTRKLEIGGLVNINRGRTEGWQLGGIANITGEEVHGVQIGGIVNAVRDSVYGVQIGGILNMNGRETQGIQIGGIANFVGDKLYGVQVAGIVNLNGKTVEGVQVSGITNLVQDKLQGVQMAGIANFNGGITEGIQGAGIANVSLKGLNGWQVAGISNITWGEVNGYQISSIFNFAQKINHGWQIGLINYVDSASNLRQIGLINFARKGGYKDLELSTNEMNFINFTVRSGTPYFYTLFRLGLRPTAERPFWHYGYGVGFARFWKRNWNFTNELVYHRLLRTLGKNSNKHQFILRLQSDFTKKFTSRWGIAMGLALNLLYLKPESLDFGKAENLAPIKISELKTQNHIFQISAGINLGLRYLLD
jgi:hypothetical protein